MIANKTAEGAKNIYTKRDIIYGSRAENIRFSNIIELIGSGKKVLDVGCYNGSIGARLIQNDNEVYGIEINPAAAETACKKGLKVNVQDIESRFEFEDRTFDTVIATEVIEHILDTDYFLSEIKRVLRPGGTLVISTPNVASLGRRITLLLGGNPYFEASLSYPVGAHSGHIRFFTKALLLDYLKHNGFEIVKFSSDAVTVVPSGNVVIRWLARLFPTLGRSLIVQARLAG